MSAPQPLPSDPVEVTVESFGGLGDGVAQLNGQPLFISKSCIGDRLEVRLTRHTSEGYTGIITQIIAPGPDRSDAPCPYFSACGGCSLQQLHEQRYREFKTRMLHSAIARAGFEPNGAEILFLPPATRRRVEFKTCFEDGKLTLAFYAARSRTPVPIRTCLILTPELEALMLPLQQALRGLTFAGSIRAVSLTRADSGIDLMLQLSAPAAAPQKQLTALLESLNLARASLRINDAPPAIIAERAPVTMRFGASDIPLPPDAFLQATAQGQQALTEFVLAGIPANAPVLDLFCGLGTYSFPLLARQRVHAVEMDAGMINTLKTQAKNHPHFTAEQRDLFKDPIPPEALNAYSSVVINPPRMGAKSQTQAIAASRISHVVMVSCNPATFGRDALALKNAGFTLQSASGIDQFVWSPHLEIIARFVRK